MQEKSDNKAKKICFFVRQMFVPVNARPFLVPGGVCFLVKRVAAPAVLL